ncbi:MAG: murein biosynthesis integral membrane protein MurJ [Planctomycetota bacterium]
MVKGFRQIAFLTALSRIFGMIRDVCFAYFLGAGGLMDAWSIAFKIPNLARRLFGEGAASASLIPVYSEELEKDPEKAARLANTVVTAVFILLVLVVLLGWISMGLYRYFSVTTAETRLVLSLSSVMLPYMVLVCTVAILAGILNVHRHFAAPAAAPILLNVFIIGSLVLTGWLLNVPPDQRVFYVAAAVLMAGLAQVALQLWPLRQSRICIRPAWDIYSPGFQKIIWLMGPMILGLTVTQINTLADDLIAYWLSGSPEKGQFFTFLGKQIEYPLWRGSVSHLYYAQRLYQLPLGVFGISLATAVFPMMSSAAARKDFSRVSETIGLGLRGAVFVALPATVGLILVSRPLVSVMFEHGGRFIGSDTIKTSWTLLFYSLGLTGFFSQQIVTRAYYSMQDSAVPARSAVVAVFVNIALNLVLIWFLGTGGLALSTAVCSYLQVLILLIMLRRRLGRHILKGLGREVAQCLIGTFVMSGAGLVILLVLKNSPALVKLIVTIPSAVIVYWLCAKAFGSEMLQRVRPTKNN